MTCQLMPRRPQMHVYVCELLWKSLCGRASTRRKPWTKKSKIKVSLNAITSCIIHGAHFTSIYRWMCSSFELVFRTFRGCVCVLILYCNNSNLWIENWFNSSVPFKVVTSLMKYYVDLVQFKHFVRHNVSAFNFVSFWFGQTVHLL